MRYLFLLITYPLWGILALRSFALAAGMYIFTNVFRPLEFSYMAGALPLAQFVFIILLLAWILGIASGRVQPHFGIVFWTAVLFLLWATLSALLSPFYPQTIDETIGIAKFILPIGLLATGLTEKRHIELFLLCLVGAIAIWGVRFGITCLTTLSPSIYMYVKGGQLTDNNDFAAALASMLPLFLCALLTYRGRFRRSVKVLISAGFVLCLAQIVFSQSRGAAVSILANIVMYLFFISSNKLRDIVIVAIVGAALMFLLPQSFFHRMSTIELGVEQRDESAAARLHHMQSALKCALDHPVVGIGPMSYINVSRQYSDRNPTQPHNMWLKIAAEVGFVGLGIYVLMVIVVLRSLMRMYNNAKLRSMEGSQEWSTLAAALISSIFCYSCAQSFLNHYQLETYWGLLAAGTALCRAYWTSLADAVEDGDQKSEVQVMGQTSLG